MTGLALRFVFLNRPYCFEVNVNLVSELAVSRAAWTPPVQQRKTTCEFLLIFCTGLGLVMPEVASGDVAPSTEPLARTLSTPLVHIAGLPAQVTFSGLAPGFVGLYQVNVQVPAGVPSGTQKV